MHHTPKYQHNCASAMHGRFIDDSPPVSQRESVVELVWFDILSDKGHFEDDSFEATDCTVLTTTTL